MSPTRATAVLVLVVVVVAGAGYAGLDSFAPSPTASTHTCSPPTAPQCASQAGLNDVVLFVPYQPGVGQSIVSLTEGQSIPATVSLSGGESASGFSVSWGDGTTHNSTSATSLHSYAGLGTYVLSATAVVAGVTHTGTDYLFPVQVAAPLASVSSGDFPTLTTTFSNGSTDGPNYPWIHQGGEVSVSASYIAIPTTTGYSTLPPSILSSGGTLRSSTNGSARVSATYAFDTPGQFRLTMVGPVMGPTGMIYQNYTWSVYVGAAGMPLGCSDCRPTGTADPHPGVLELYRVMPGGASSLDPAVDYDVAGTEVIQNIYETLVEYNGSSSASYVPVLSTCIPGPAAMGPTSCQSQYGSDLVQGNDWTFPIDSNARFYDPGTGRSWGVYPSDVMFSVARTLMWLEDPAEYVTPGWIFGQSLLPFGNAAWDGALHVPWNNTPQTVYGSMMVNDTRYCPESIQSTTHGCITFNTGGSGTSWPEFLEFVADSEGASVVPCGWLTGLSVGLPGFTTSAPDGDGPCLLPGGATTTNSSEFQQYVATASPTGFDTVISLGSTNIGDPDPQVRYLAEGSGPYFLESVNPGQGYILQANPDYAQPNCATQPNCFPAPRAYAGKVYVFWDPDTVLGIEQYIAGDSDQSDVNPSDIPTILNLVHQGKVGIQSFPTLWFYGSGFSFEFDPARTQSESGLPTNIPGNFFSYVGMREFLAQAFPYATNLDVANTVDGIPFDQGVGGVIPQYLGDYYPQNITWPGMNTSGGGWPQVWQDPSTASGCTSIVGSACWWWANITSPGTPSGSNPYYDPEAVACEQTPCTFPFGSESWMPSFDLDVNAWGNIVTKITHGAIAPSRWSPVMEAGPGDLPGTGPFATYFMSWGPDYPDPTDYMVPFYLPDGYFTFTAALNETLVDDQFGGSYQGCADHGATDFVDLVYWADYSPLVPQDCQGTAYVVMTWAVDLAASMPDGAQRVLFYNLAEHVANGLALDIYVDQPVGIVTDASWINPSSVNAGPIWMGYFWFEMNGNGVA